MKNILLIVALIAFTLPAAAQQEGKHRRHHERPEITELVSDLNAGQKRKLENITQQSKQRVGLLRKQQRAVRDSIGIYMNREGDQSKMLYPLFDRESQLQAAISREMYNTKLRIDEVLTPAQRQELRKAGRKKGK